MRRFMLSAATIALVAGFAASEAKAKIFQGDSFRVVQEAATSFGFFINNNRVRSLGDDLRASFTQNELADLLLANNNFNAAKTALATFTEFVDRDLSGLVRARINQDKVVITFDEQLVSRERSGEVSFKYDGPLGSDREFVQVSGERLVDPPPFGSTDVSPDDVPGVSAEDSRGGTGPFRNDTFTITQQGGSFALDINGVMLMSLNDDGGDLSFQIDANTFKELILANNGVGGRFLGDDTFFFEFLAKGNSGLIDVALSNESISFDIDRAFVTHERSGDSVFKYNAAGKRARNFVNFVGVVGVASPSS